MMINIWKIGSNENPASSSDIQSIVDQLKAAKEQNKTDLGDIHIVTHHKVSLEQIVVDSLGTIVGTVEKP